MKRKKPFFESEDGDMAWGMILVLCFLACMVVWAESL